MERGEGLPVFELDNGLRLGILTCYDGWFPEPARALSLQGAEMIVWINGRGGSVEDFIVQATMFQSHVAMVTTNQACESDPLSWQLSRKLKTLLRRWQRHDDRRLRRRRRRGRRRRHPGAVRGPAGGLHRADARHCQDEIATGKQPELCAEEAGAV